MGQANEIIFTLENLYLIYDNDNKKYRNPKHIISIVF